MAVDVFLQIRIEKALRRQTPKGFHLLNDRGDRI
jgi:hypothetical protein